MHLEGKGTGLACSGRPEIKGTDGQVQAEREIQRSSPHSAHFSLALFKFPAGRQRPKPHSTPAGKWLTVAPREASGLAEGSPCVLRSCPEGPARFVNPMPPFVPDVSSQISLGFWCLERNPPTPAKCAPSCPPLPPWHPGTGKAVRLDTRILRRVHVEAGAWNTGAAGDPGLGSDGESQLLLEGLQLQ